MDIDKQLAVQSYCFHNFKDNNKVIELVKECGLSVIELCAVHADFNDESQFDDIIGLYTDNGIEIVSIGVESFTDDEEAARKRFEFVKKAGAKLMSVNFRPDSVPESYHIVEKLADEYNVNCGIHNHGARHWLGNSQMLSHVFSITSERIGLNLDTGWAQDSGEDPVNMCEKYGDRLYMLHLKDFLFEESRKRREMIVGTGNLDLPALYSVLDGLSYSGPFILEYEADPEKPVESLKKCIDNIKKG